MRIRSATIPLVVLTVLFVAGCAAGDTRFTTEDPAGFWYGLWHGLIAPIAFVISLFSDNVEIYERANNGGWYDFGYLLGLLCIGGGGHQSQRRLRHAKSSRGGWPRGRGKARVKIDVDWTGDEPEAEASPDPGSVPLQPPR
jgi:hypothetical protein